MVKLLSKCGISDVYFFTERWKNNMKRYIYKAGYIKLPDGIESSEEIPVSDSEEETLCRLTNALKSPGIRSWMVRSNNEFYRLVDVTDFGEFIIETEDLGTLDISEDGKVNFIN